MTIATKFHTQRPWSLLSCPTQQKVSQLSSFSRLTLRPAACCANISDVRHCRPWTIMTSTDHKSHHIRCATMVNNFRWKRPTLFIKHILSVRCDTSVKRGLLVSDITGRRGPPVGESNVSFEPSVEAFQTRLFNDVHETVVSFALSVLDFSAACLTFAKSSSEDCWIPQSVTATCRVPWTWVCALSLPI